MILETVGASAALRAGEYTFAGVSLPAGTWANWVSGLASSAAVIVALSAHFISARAARKKQVERQHEVARQVGFKLWRLAIQNEAARSVVEQQPIESFDEEERADLWRWMTSAGSLPTIPSLGLGTEENNLLIALGEVEFAMTFELCVERFHAFTRFANQWDERRDALTATFETSSIEGDVAFHIPTVEGRLRASREGIVINGFIRAAQEVWQQNAEVLPELITSYVELVESRLGISDIAEKLRFTGPIAADNPSAASL